MPSGQKRKGSPGAETDSDSAKRRFIEDLAADDEQNQTQTPEDVPSTEAAETEQVETSTTTVNPQTDRMARFKALQARQAAARKQNLKETAIERQRSSIDSSLLPSMNRKHAIASHKALMADTEAAGEDFERKRAWDWTVEEAEKWDRRLEKKERHRQNVAFQDYRQDAQKSYKREMKNLKPDLEGYELSKREAIEKAASRGGLEIVETETGELIAVDKDGSFYSTAESTDFMQNKPDKAAVDRLVEDIRKAEAARLKARRHRGKDDDADVTYINEKNAQFNKKLARFYNKYTAEIRENFERGTAI